MKWLGQIIHGLFAAVCVILGYLCLMDALIDSNGPKPSHEQVQH